MKKLLIIYVITLTGLSACEDIYNPELEKMEPLLVIDARIIYGQTGNYIQLYKTVNFSGDSRVYPSVNGASVTLTDERNNMIPLQNSGSGIFILTQPLDSVRKYKIVIVAEGEVYVSAFQKVPAIPDIDSVYAEPWEEIVKEVTDQAAGNLQKQSGARLYADIKSRNKNIYYRFSGQKICQYTHQFISRMYGQPMEETMFGWISFKPEGVFNIAAPPDYSSSLNISKHQLVFLESSYPIMVGDTLTSFSGWIYICKQYAISEETYHFYKDLNNQLTAKGKLFDPMYTQARSNILCSTSPEKTVLGNFEISAVKEHRFFVEYRGNNKYFLKKIPYFYLIPPAGRSPVFQPEWWESPSKRYP